MPSPYNPDPPPNGNTSKIPDMADAIFYGNKGVLVDAAVLANLTAVITNGMVAALTNNSVKNALKEVICDGTSDGYDKILANHPEGLQVSVDPAQFQQAIYDAFVQLADDGYQPTVDQWSRAFSLLALATSSSRKSTFLDKTTSAAYEGLKERITKIDVGSLKS